MKYLEIEKLIEFIKNNSIRVNSNMHEIDAIGKQNLLNFVENYKNNPNNTVEY